MYVVGVWVCVHVSGCVQRINALGLLELELQKVIRQRGVCCGDPACALQMGERTLPCRAISAALGIIIFFIPSKYTPFSHNISRL